MRGSSPQIQIQINLLIKRPKGQQYNRNYTMILIDTHKYTNEDINENNEIR
jgi:hypothetical protein